MDQGETWGLVALHIIEKNFVRPDYFIFMTFGHVDNIIDMEGKPAESPAGKPLTQAHPANPQISNTSCRVQGDKVIPQVLTPPTASSVARTVSSITPTKPS